MDCRIRSQNVVSGCDNFPSTSWTSVVRHHFEMDAGSTDCENRPGSVVRSGQITESRRNEYRNGLTIPCMYRLAEYVPW
jgi:hypothetical protein